MPKPLRGVFHKRRKLLDDLFTTAIESLRDWMRARLELPDGQLAAVAAVAAVAAIAAVANLAICPQRELSALRAWSPLHLQHGTGSAL
jgi:hypothetical protein